MSESVHYISRGIYTAKGFDTNQPVVSCKISDTRFSTQQSVIQLKNFHRGRLFTMLLLIFTSISVLLISVLCGKKRGKSSSKEPVVSPAARTPVTPPVDIPTTVNSGSRETWSAEPPIPKNGKARMRARSPYRNRRNEEVDRRRRKKKGGGMILAKLFGSREEKSEKKKMGKKKEEKSAEKMKKEEEEKKERQLLDEMSALELVEPKEIALTKKEEMIKEGKLQPKKRNEYPTFQDIESDWDSEKEREQKKKDEEKIPPGSAKPREIALTKKEEMIKDGKLKPKKRNEYPTFQDIASDWDSEKEKEQKKKDAEKERQEVTGKEPDPNSEKVVEMPETGTPVDPKLSKTQFETGSAPGSKELGR